MKSFRHAPFRYVRRVPNSTLTHVSVSPPFHPGRSDFPSPVGDHGFPQTAFPIQRKLKCRLTYTPRRIGLLLGSRWSFDVPAYPGLVSCAGFLPTPPCAESPFACKRRYLLQRDVSQHVRRSYPPFIAHTGSCAKPNSSRRLRLTNTAGLCRLSLVPAGRWPFPILSLQSLRRRLDPYPAVSLWCACSLLPREQRPHLGRHKFGTLKIHLQCNFNRKVFSGLQSFTNVQAPTLVSPPGCTYR